MSQRAKRHLPTLLIVLVCTAFAPAGTTASQATEAVAAAPALEAEVVEAVNDSRRDAGLAPVEASGELTGVARHHSAAMAGAGVLHHDPALGAVIADWSRLGENVGRGREATAVHDAFLASPTHAANVFEPAYDEVGVGVVVADGEVWVTTVYRTR